MESIPRKSVQCCTFSIPCLPLSAVARKTRDHKLISLHSKIFSLISLSFSDPLLLSLLFSPLSFKNKKKTPFFREPNPAVRFRLFVFPSFRLQPVFAQSRSFDPAIDERPTDRPSDRRVCFSCWERRNIFWLGFWYGFHLPRVTSYQISSLHPSVSNGLILYDKYHRCRLSINKSTFLGVLWPRYRMTICNCAIVTELHLSGMGLPVKQHKAHKTRSWE